jgi:hypothetical protein
MNRFIFLLFALHMLASVLPAQPTGTERPPGKHPSSWACNDTLRVSLDTACRAVIVPDMILEGGYSGHASLLVRLFDEAGLAIGDTVGRAHIGQRLTAVLEDTAGGNNCQSVLYAEDLLPPDLVCTDLTVPCAIGDLHPDRLRAEFSLASALPLASDNCSGVTLSHTDTLTAASCDSNRLAGVLLRTWTGTDDSGNRSSCAQTIFIRLIALSDVAMPADTIFSCSTPRSDPQWTGVPGVYFQKVFVPIFPNQGSCSILITHADQALPICDGSWNLLRTWRLADWCQTDTLGPTVIHHTQAINIQDKTPPVFACPENITVSTGPKGCSRDLDLPDVIVEDACSRLSLFRADWMAEGQPVLLFGAFSDFPGNNPTHADTLGVMGLAMDLPLGTTPIRYTATDDCGNQRSCSFLVTVQDSVVPSAVCNGFIKVALSHDGSTLLNASSIDDGSYDHCGPVFFKARRLTPNFCQPNSRFFDQVRFCCADVGDTIEVVLRVYDQVTPKGEISLNLLEQYASDCFSKVLVEDNIKPVCVAPPNLTVSCAAFDPSLGSYGNAAGFDNCCVLPAEEQVHYSQFDTVCSRGTILRAFRVSDCNGLNGACTQRITVTHEQDYAVRFPDDRVVFECGGLQIAPDYPTFEGKDCALLAVSFEDQVYASVPDACYLINRTWKVVNWCAYDPNTPLIQVPNPEPHAQTMHPSNRPGPVVSRPGTPAPWAASVVSIRPTDPAPTNFSAFWDEAANGYLYRQTIRVVDGEPPVVVDCHAEVTACDLTANDPLFWNHPAFADPINGGRDLCEGPVNLSVTATDLCAEANIQFRYLLLLDLNGDGQPETAISSAQLPGFNRVNLGNAENPNFAGGTPTPFDGRPVPQVQQYGFGLQVTQTGNHHTARVAWNSAQSPNTWTTPVLPHGRHRIQWVITDPCGNQSSCTQELVVADCKPPTTVCRHGLAVSLMPSRTATLWTGDLLTYAADNCTPPDQIRHSMRKKGSGQGFPLNAQGQPIDALTFNCADPGNTEVELWSSDLAGNADFCLASVQIQDPSGACSATQAVVSGTLRTEYGQAVPGAKVRISAVDSTGMHLETGAATDTSGRFVLSDFPHADYQRFIIPEKDDQYINGVSTYDLVLISRHILGITPLNSPYKMIAADVNRSGSITTLDIVALRKLILGVHATFPNNLSWRFVDAAYTFPNPSNPFSTPFPEQQTLPNGIPAGTNYHFVAVKTGDVDGSATLASKENNSRETKTLFIDLSTEGATWVEAGQVYTATLRPRGQTLGYQLTLELNDADLIRVIPGPGISTDNFGVFDHTLTASVDGDYGFDLVLKAKKSSYWSGHIRLSDKITPSVAYDPAGTVMQIALLMAPYPLQKGRGLELYPNLPNPFHQQTTVRFTLPQDAEATLSILDAQGRLHWQEAALLPAGTHERVLKAPLFTTKGVWYCRLDALGLSATRSMLCLDP